MSNTYACKDSDPGIYCEHACCSTGQTCIIETIGGTEVGSCYDNISKSILYATITSTLTTTANPTITSTVTTTVPVSTITVYQSVSTFTVLAAAAASSTIAPGTAIPSCLDTTCAESARLTKILAPVLTLLVLLICAIAAFFLWQNHKKTCGAVGAAGAGMTHNPAAIYGPVPTSSPVYGATSGGAPGYGEIVAPTPHNGPTYEASSLYEPKYQKPIVNPAEMRGKGALPTRKTSSICA